jgi:hypothetical protein
MTPTEVDEIAGRWDGEHKIMLPEVERLSTRVAELEAHVTGERARTADACAQVAADAARALERHIAVREAQIRKADQRADRLTELARVLYQTRERTKDDGLSIVREAELFALRDAVAMEPTATHPLSPADGAELRRVRAIIQRLHHREHGEWGDPLDGCLQALSKAIKLAGDL